MGREKKIIYIVYYVTKVVLSGEGGITHEPLSRECVIALQLELRTILYLGPHSFPLKKYYKIYLSLQRITQLKLSN